MDTELLKRPKGENFAKSLTHEGSDHTKTDMLLNGRLRASDKQSNIVYDGFYHLKRFGNCYHLGTNAEYINPTPIDLKEVKTTVEYIDWLNDYIFPLVSKELGIKNPNSVHADDCDNYYEEWDLFRQRDNSLYLKRGYDLMFEDPITLLGTDYWTYSLLQRGIRRIDGWSYLNDELADYIASERKERQLMTDQTRKLVEKLGQHYSNRALYNVVKTEYLEAGTSELRFMKCAIRGNEQYARRVKKRLEPFKDYMYHHFTYLTDKGLFNNQQTYFIKATLTFDPSIADIKTAHKDYYHKWFSPLIKAIRNGGMCYRAKALTDEGYDLNHTKRGFKTIEDAEEYLSDYYPVGKQIDQKGYKGMVYEHKVVEITIDPHPDADYISSTEAFKKRGSIAEGYPHSHLLLITDRPIQRSRYNPNYLNEDYLAFLQSNYEAGYLKVNCPTFTDKVSMDTQLDNLIEYPIKYLTKTLGSYSEDMTPSERHRMKEHYFNLGIVTIFKRRSMTLSHGWKERFSPKKRFNGFIYLSTVKTNVSVPKNVKITYIGTVRWQRLWNFMSNFVSRGIPPPKDPPNKVLMSNTLGELFTAELGDDMRLSEGEFVNCDLSHDDKEPITDVWDIEPEVSEV